MSDTDLTNYKWADPKPQMCVTCSAKPAVRLTVGAVDGPYWCSEDCKQRWMLPTPADAVEPGGRDGTPVEAVDLYEQVMRRTG